MKCLTLWKSRACFASTAHNNAEAPRPRLETVCVAAKHQEKLDCSGCNSRSAVFAAKAHCVAIHDHAVDMSLHPIASRLRKTSVQEPAQ